ncbi:hypothetical protein GOV03_03360 [Candidatus Woesearchaeota archaeon]|nr:hypothetical protein [Candidatus Woesearchaeota archaeon]
MGWLKSTLYGLVLTTALGLSVPEQGRQDLWNRYRGNIEYQNLSEIDFSSLSEEKIDVPIELEKKIEDKQRMSRVENQELLEELIFSEIKKVGVELTELEYLAPKEAIMLAMDVAASVFEYTDVDGGKEFIEEHGSGLPIEKYMALGQGDCDKYSEVAALTFNLLKESNSQLKNIYLVDDQRGPEKRHAWITAVILNKHKIITTSLDPTFYDEDKERLEGEVGIHIAENDLLRLADFYSLLLVSKQSYALMDEIMEEKTIPEKEKDRFLANLFFEVQLVQDKEKMEIVREAYMKLETQNYLDDILYWSYYFEKREGNSAAATAYKNWLLTDFPDSFWSQELNESMD